MNDKIEMVTVPLWKMERAANVLENDGDESGVARDIRYMIKGSPKPEAQAAGVLSGLRRYYFDGDGVDNTAEFVRLDEAKAALSTPASHDAQQPSSAMVKVALRNLPQYISKCSLIGPDKHSAMLCFETLRDALVQQPAVVGDAIRHLTKWLDAAECECEGGHRCGRDDVQRTRDQLAALTLAATPVDKQGRDAAQVMRDALAYVNVRTDGDLLALVDRAENWIRESRVLINMQAKLIAAQKEGNGNG